MFFASPESPKVLDNDYLDFFTRVHYLSVPVLFVPITLAALAYSAFFLHVGVLANVALFAAGVFAWTFAEYWLHRTLFHWVPKSGWGQRFHFWVHGIHHTYPSDPYRLVMPPWVNLSLLVFVFGPPILWVAPVWGYAFLAGFVAGYTNYDVTHYFIHHHRPKSARYKRLRAHHMNHHHNHGDLRFGVSFTFWDRVFGTAR